MYFKFDMLTWKKVYLLSNLEGSSIKEAFMENTSISIVSRPHIAFNIMLGKMSHTILKVIHAGVWIKTKHDNTIHNQFIVISEIFPSVNEPASDLQQENKVKQQQQTCYH